jgi:hypothetical protein
MERALENMKQGCGYGGIMELDIADLRFIRVMPSVRDLLPTFPFLIYSGISNVAEPLRCEANAFLQRLNSNLDSLKGKGVELAIFAGKGMQTPKTLNIASITVPCERERKWPDGKPGSADMGDGDERVLLSSACVDGISMAAKPAKHGDLPHAFRKEIVQFLDTRGAGIPLAQCESLSIPVMLPDTPSYMHSEHRLVLANWLLRNPKFRPAVTADCHCDEDLPAIRRSYDNELPYYVSGDFNRDGYTDFAVVLIDKSKDTSQAIKVIKRNPDGSETNTFDPHLGFNTALVIFNGPTTGEDRPALFVEGTGSPGGSVLFYNKAESRFLIGKWESGGFLIAPSRDGYILQQ